MKKILSVVLSMLFVMGMVGSAFAIHAEIPSDTQAVVAKGGTQLTLSGEVRVRGWYLKNFTGLYRANANPGDTVSQSWYDQRVRLGIDAQITPNTSGFVQLESAPSAAGVPNLASDVYRWGTLNGKSAADLTILQAWILHKGSGLLGIPAGLKVGHMPLALGEKQFLDHTKFGDDAVVFFMDPSKEVHIGLLTAKFAEGSGTPTVTIVNPGADHGADTNGYVGLITYKLDKDNTIGLNYALVNAQALNNFNFQNLGLHANGNISGVTYKAEIDLQFGSIGAQDALAGTDKAAGSAILLGLGYKVDPVNIRVELGRGSGDNNANDNKNKEFQVTSGNDIHYTQIYEYTTRTAAARNGGSQYIAGTGAAATRSSGLANTTYYRLGLDMSPAKDLTASLDAFVLRATKEAAGVSKKIGSEIDVKLAYKIDKNLTYSIMAGHMNTGKWWDPAVTGGAGITAAGQNKNITQAMHALTLSF